MSHEIRTPMNGVLQILESISPTVPAAQRPLVDMARSSGRALLRIMNGILDYTKLSSGNSIVQFSTVDIREAIKTVVDLYSAEASKKGLELRVDASLDADTCRIRTDEVKLFEVISNVVSNSLKFTDRGFVEIAASCTRSASGRVRVRLGVTDTGIGMSQAELAELFTPFYQVDSRTTRSHDGTGLGLAISKEIVSLLGGEMNISSQTGLGTKVSVSFEADLVEDVEDTALRASAPRGELLSALESASAEPAQATSAVIGCVLLVEDNELNAALAQDVLELLGYETVLAKDGGAALVKWAERRFDIVLMDCQMPVLDGYETTRRIRLEEARRPDVAPVPIIAVTANTLVGDRQKCLACGMSDYLAKPYTLRQLGTMLAKWQPRSDAGVATSSCRR